jgi:hypothetical protein
MTKTLASLLFILFLAYPCFPQLTFKVQTGLSYIEHLSTGITLSFSEKHNISLLYGSNFFIKPKDFSTYMLQYHLKLNRMNFGRMTPAIGIKGGRVIYSDDYYKWELLTIIPFVGLHYQVNERLDIAMDLGPAISFEQSVQRISYGEIGKYRDLLPEFKIGTHYRF